MIKKRNIALVSLLFLPGLALAQDDTSAPTAATNPSEGSSNSKEIFVDVGRANKKKMRLAVAPFVYLDGKSPAPAEAAQTPGAEGQPKKKSPTPKNDLAEYKDYFESLFKFLSLADVLPTNLFQASPDAAKRVPQFEDWAAIQADLLVFGRVKKKSSKSFNLELTMYNVKNRKTVFSRSYNNVEKKKFKNIMRRFADLSLEKLTGTPGPFSTRIAFLGRKSRSALKQVYVANIDGSDMVQVTKGNDAHLSPSWSPDGSKLAFTSFRDNNAEIYVKNFITGGLLRLTRNKYNDSGAAWHPNGNRIIFSSSNGKIQQIYSVSSLTGGNKRTLIQGKFEVEGSFSPDGKQVAWASGRYGGRPHVFVKDMATQKETRVTFAGTYNTTPRWRPDGKKLVISSFDKDIGRYDIFISNPNGTQLERLTLEQGDNESGVFSPDGRFILFQSNRIDGKKNAGPYYGLYIMNRDGGNPIKIPIPLLDVTGPDWSPRINELNKNLPY